MSACYGTGASTAAGKLVTMPQAPTGKCEVLGELTGKSGGFFGAWYKDSTLAESAENDLANQAAERGATHVHKHAPNFFNNEAGRHDRAEVRGVAYKCIGQVTYGGESAPAAQASRARPRKVNAGCLAAEAGEALPGTLELSNGGKALIYPYAPSISGRIHQGLPTPCVSVIANGSAGNTILSWQASYRLNGRELCLTIDQLQHKLAAHNSVELGYTVHLKGATFADGEDRKNIVVHALKGSAPDAKGGSLCVPINAANTAVPAPSTYPLKAAAHVGAVYQYINLGELFSAEACAAACDADPKCLTASWLDKERECLMRNHLSYATTTREPVFSWSKQTPPPAPDSQLGGAALGSTQPVDGCIPGHAYAVADGSSVPDVYGADAPAAELWSCRWNVALSDGASGFAGAQSGAWYVLRHQGVFSVPTAGEYVFALGSSYPWRLTIDGRVFTGQASQPLRVALKAGEHPVLLEYLYMGGRAFALDLRVTRPGGAPMAFALDRGSPFYAMQSVRYVGTRQLSDNWQSLASVDAEEIRILQQVHFETASAQIRKDDQSEAVLFAVAQILSEHPEIKRVEVQGHTDDQGSDAYNLDLSQRRAASVRKWLVDAGIAPHRLVARGYGKTRPLAANASTEGRASNRRVQFVIEGEASSGPGATGDGMSSDSADGEGDLRVLIAGAILRPSDELAELMPPQVGTYTRVWLETNLHLRGLSAAGIYQGPSSDKVLAILVSAIDGVLIREKFTREVAGFPANGSGDEAPLLYLSPRTALMITKLTGREHEDFVGKLQPARMRKVAEQRVDALPKKKPGAPPKRSRR